MSADANPYPRVAGLIDTFAAWLRHRRELNEIHELDRVEFDRIAADLRVSPGDLEELVRQGPEGAHELPELFKALGIDMDAVACAQPVLLRDMERVCAMCANKRRCDHELATGTIAEHFSEYCLNAPTIEQLQPVKPRQD